MTETFARFITPGAILLLTLASGIWLSRAGKPLSTAIFTLHKLVALAAVIAAAVQTYGTLGGPGTQADLVALIVVAAAGALALFVTGALMSAVRSLSTPGYSLLLRIHNIAPVVVVFAMALAIYLTGRGTA